MKVYVINLERRIDRRTKIIKAFESYSFNNYEIIDAIDGLDLSIEQINENYDKKHGERLYRELTTAEIATALSHKKVYRKILDNNENGAIIIEDDLDINQTFVDYANHQDPLIECDCLLLSYFSTNRSNNTTPEYKHQNYNYEIMDDYGCRVYFKNSFVECEGYKYYEFDEKSYKIDFVQGAHCYYITKTGCETLLKKNTPIVLEADNIWNFYHDVRIYGIRPMLASYNITFSDSDIQEQRSVYQKTNRHSKYFTDRKCNPLYGT